MSPDGRPAHGHHGVRELADAVAGGRSTAVSAVEEALSRIDAADGRIRAFLEVTPEAALAEARAVDARVAAGERPPLAGVPVAMKDNMWVAGRKTGCASRILEGFRPPGDSTVAARLRAAGAVFVGRANMDEFAMGSSTENSAYQVTRNPWDLQRVAGGSSGGSAAAVAAGLVPVALGTDTGGSVRVPAALCGVVGLKTTVGQVSRTGVHPLSWTLDSVGPIARTVEDAALATT